MKFATGLFLKNLISSNIFVVTQMRNLSRVIFAKNHFLINLILLHIHAFTQTTNLSNVMCVTSHFVIDLISLHILVVVTLPHSDFHAIFSI